MNKNTRKQNDLTYDNEFTLNLIIIVCQIVFIYALLHL